MYHATIHTRQPAVAGMFYPADAADLRHEVTRLLREAGNVGPYPKALIVPHAGYAYSGPVAAAAYCLLKPIQQLVRRVVLVGPAHRVPFYGLAVPEADEFATPLGNIAVDHKSLAATLKLPQVHVLERVHRPEHSLEVQLPFLQLILHQFSLVPLVVGNAQPSEVREVLELLWDDAENLIIVSSDLSHYHSYSTARAMDSQTAHLIERCQWRQIDGERACGYLGICGLLQLAEERRLKVETVDLRNSGDTFSPDSPDSVEHVVGYGSFIVY
jgi:AmmeMemoRadiSam system protein B